MGRYRRPVEQYRFNDHVWTAELEYDEHPAFPVNYPIVNFSLGANGINQAVIHIFPVGDGSPMIRFWFLVGRASLDFGNMDELIERLTKLGLGEPKNLDEVYEVLQKNKGKFKKAKPENLERIYKEIEGQLKPLIA